MCLWKQNIIYMVIYYVPTVFKRLCMFHSVDIKRPFYNKINPLRVSLSLSSCIYSIQLSRLPGINNLDLLSRKTAIMHLTYSRAEASIRSTDIFTFNCLFCVKSFLRTSTDSDPLQIVIIGSILDEILHLPCSLKLRTISYSCLLDIVTKFAPLDVQSLIESSKFSSSENVS